MNKDIDLLINLQPTEIELDLQVSQESGIWEEYKGSYNVIPNWNDQVLATKDKVLTDNVKVDKIPKYKTENIGGGYTVIIGGNE